MKKHILPLLLGVVVLAAAVAWSFAVLPDLLKQDKLGASIEEAVPKGIGKGAEQQIKKGVEELLPDKQEPKAPKEKSATISGQAPAEVVEVPKENAIPVFLAPPQVKVGNKIQVTVGAPNPASVRSIEIFLQSPSGLQTSQANIWNINGEGQWFDDVPISQDAELGLWKVKTIEITNTEGNITSYVFGTDIFSTFTVE